MSGNEQAECRHAARDAARHELRAEVVEGATDSHLCSILTDAKNVTDLSHWFSLEESEKHRLPIFLP